MYNKQKSNAFRLQRALKEKATQFFLGGRFYADILISVRSNDRFRRGFPVKNENRFAHAAHIILFAVLPYAITVTQI